jgi:CRISPR type I-D/CYANO-associated protein Csc2
LTENLLNKPSILPVGKYLQLVVKLKFLNDAIIRSNDPEEVLTFRYKDLGNRFIIPWRKVKGKLRRITMEKQRSIGVAPQCHLKDDLCMQCPSCFIFGGTGETSNANVSYNILSRVLGETFISTTEVGDITPYTQNAVDEINQQTGQALMNIITVPAETEFLGVVTVKDPTPEIASIIINNLLRLSRIGARTVEWGRIRTNIVGYKLSDSEDLSAYESMESGMESLETIDKLNLPALDESYKTLNEQVRQLFNESGLT